MSQHFCTPIPARRISVNGRLELRLATDDAASAQIDARLENGEVRECGRFPLKAGRQLNIVHPDMSGLTGRLTLPISFLSEDGAVLEVKEQPY